jgi:hypothetical protein
MRKALNAEVAEVAQRALEVVYEAGDSVLEVEDVEVDQEADLVAAELQLGQELCAVDRG